MISAHIELRAAGTDCILKLGVGSPITRIQKLNYINLANGFKCGDSNTCLSVPPLHGGTTAILLSH